MTTIELGELAKGAESSAAGKAAEKGAEAAADAAAEEESTGEFLLEVFDRLDERGMLGKVLFGPEFEGDLGGPSAEDQANPAKVEQGDGGESAEIDADAVADIGKKVIDAVGDVKMSELVKFAENNPEQVDQLIQQHMGGE